MRLARFGRGAWTLNRFSYLLLAVFVVVTLGPALVGRGALIDSDGLTALLPFASLHGVHVNDAVTCRSDTLNYYLPGIAEIRDAFRSGSFPTWDPYKVGGTPLASLPNQAALSPLSLPYYVLPLWMAPAFVKLGEFAVAIAGMVAFLGRLGVSRGASVLAGIIFSTSGFMMMWTNWPHTRVAAFIPALFWGLERVVQQRRGRDVAIVAVVVASMLLGGFPAVTLFALTLGAAYVVVRAFSSFGRQLRPVVGVLARAGAGVLLGVGLAAIQILPFALNLGAMGLDERDSAGVHLPLGLFLTTVVPDNVGTCVAYQTYGPTIPIEAIGFLGAAALVLVLCAVLIPLPREAAPDRTPRIFFVVALVVVVILVWLGGPLLAAFQRLPFYSTNSITRAQSIFGFVGAVLAGIGIDRLVRGLAARRGGSVERPQGRIVARRVVTSVLVLVVVLGFGALVVVRARHDAQSDHYLEYWSGTLLIPSLYVAGAVAAVLFTLLGPARLRVLGPVVIAVLVVAQSAMFARTVLPLGDPDNLYPVTPSHRFLTEHLGEDRWAATGNTLYPATSSYYRLRTPTGHEFADPRWWDLLYAVDPGVFISRTYSYFPAGFTAEDSATSHVLDQLSVRYWVSPPGDVPGVRDSRPASGDAVVPLQPDEAGHCSVEGGPLRGVAVAVARHQRAPVSRPAVVHVAVHTPDGVREGSRLIRGMLPRGPLRVAVAGEDLPPGGRYPVDVWLTGVSGKTVLRADRDGVFCAGVRPTDDGLRLVFAEAGDVVFERLRALPRIRWASRSSVEPDADAQVARLKRGIPDDEVLLNDDATPAAAGEPAEVKVLSDEPERISARVNAAGGGYLVVADAVLRDGWSASVDGRAVGVVPGNHAFAAIPVPKGEHTVVLDYQAPGLAVGALVSAGSGLLLLTLLVWPWWTRRRRSVGSEEPQIP
jgi:hypothetical protein